MSGKSIVSVYSPDKPFPVYEAGAWWSDEWSPLSFGRDYDFSRPFMEQFAELHTVVPKLALAASNNENSEYVNYAFGCRNCYLVLGWGEDCEDCLYSKRLLRCKSCVDVTQGIRCEYCYECSDIENCYELFYSDTCKSCSSSYFLKNCIGCSNCFGCINLRNQKYQIFNTQYSKDAYHAKLRELFADEMQSDQARRRLAERIRASFAEQPHKYYTGLNNYHSSGDYLNNCKNAQHCYNTIGGEDLKYVCDGIVLSNCMDMSAAGENGTEFSYECVSFTGKSGLFLNLSWFCSNLIYCNECINGCSHCFGCIGLRRSSCCILNKQYTKEEYQRLLPKIIAHMKETGEWGEFFSARLSPFGYNETVAQEYFPLERENALELGFNWSDYQPPEQQSAAADSTRRCRESGKAFRLTAFEQGFYRRMSIPLPDYHPDVRHSLRRRLRNPHRLWERQCRGCKAALQSTFAPERPEPILCELCFQETISA